MNPEQESFEQLRRLLVLKRHEQPPPGYFESFSAQVIARIQAGERLPEPSWWHWEVSWLDRLWELFDAKPLAAGAFGVAVCGLLAGGIFYSDSDQSGSLAVLSASDPAQSVLTPPAERAEVSGFEMAPGSPLYRPNQALPVENRSLFQSVGRPQLVNYGLPVRP